MPFQHLCIVFALWPVIQAIICAGPSTTTNTTECWNPTIMAWEIQPFILPQPFGWRSAIDYGDLVCLAGGLLVSGASSNAVHCINSTVPAWFHAPSLIAARKGASTIYGPGWIGIAGGGPSVWEQAIPSSESTQTQLPNWNLATSTSSFPPNAYPLVWTYNGTIQATGYLTAAKLVYNSNAALWEWVAVSQTLKASGEAAVLIISPNTGLPCVVAVSNVLGVMATVQCVMATADGNYTWTVNPLEATITPYPHPLVYARNFTYQNMPCVGGGVDGNSNVLKEVKCLNHSTWINLPSFNLNRTSFTMWNYPISGGALPTSSPSLSPSPSPTGGALPTSSPSLSPSPSPSHAPTLWPQWWGVEYNSIFTASTWSTFSITLPPPSSRPSPLPPLSSFSWVFISPGTSTYGQGLDVTFPPFTFSAGVAYTFTVTLGATTSSVYSFSIPISPLRVQVSGGDHSILANSTIILDASSSFDPDLPQPVASSFLHFSWTNLTCLYASVFGPNTSSQLTLHLGKTETCTVTVVVTSTITEMVRQATAVVALEVLDYIISNIAISGPSEISTSDTLRLLAALTTTIINQPPLNSYNWTVYPPALPGQNCALPSSASSGNRALSLNGTCLSPGVVYRFSISVGNGRYTAHAWHSVSVFGVPSGGSCAMNPSSGTALVTLYTISCSGWSQVSPVSISLTYSLVIWDSLQDVETTTLISPQSQAQMTTMLPVMSVGDRVLVKITGYGQAEASFLLPMITTTPGLTCPLPGSGTLQDLIIIFSPTSASQLQSCSQQALQSSWSSLWQQLQAEQITLQQQGPPSEGELSWYVTALQAALPNMPLSFITQTQADVLDILQFLANTTYDPDTAKQILSLTSVVAPILKDNCTAVDIAITSLSKLVRTATMGNLPSDPAFSLDSGANNNVSVTSDYYFSDSQNQIQGSGATVDLPSSLVQQGGSTISSVSVSSFGSLYNPECRASKDGSVQLGSNIVDITLSSPNGNLVSVTNVSGGFSFLLTVNPNALCGELTCAWWNPTVQDWVTTGCTGSKTINPAYYRCTCTHLTEFALLLHPAVCGQLRTAFLVLMAMFCALALVTALKIGFRVKMGSKSMGNLLWQHCMIMVLCIARAVGCASLGSTISATWTLATRAAVLVFPYLLMFWIYTLMAFQWAALVHFGIKFQDKSFTQVRWVFLICNIAVCTTVVALLCMFSSTISDAQQGTLAEVASAMLAGITFVTALAFIGYALVLFRVISQTQPSRVTAQRCNLTLQTKILTGAIIVSTLLCLEAIMHVMSLSKVANNWLDESELVVMVVDWVNLVVLLGMYHKAMMERKKGTKSPGNASSPMISVTGPKKTAQSSIQFSESLESKGHEAQ